MRFSTAIGSPVREDHTMEDVGTVSGMCIDPDTAKVEGLFVTVHSFFRTEELFLTSFDIGRWGKAVHVRDASVLAPLDETIRLHRLVQEGRAVIGQRIRTEGGIQIGVCRDVQFDTMSMQVEWLFPRAWLRWKPAIPTSSIVQVTREAIIVRDAVTIPEVESGPSVLETLDPLGSGGMSRKV